MCGIYIAWRVAISLRVNSFVIVKVVLHQAVFIAVQIPHILTWEKFKRWLNRGKLLVMSDNWRQLFLIWEFTMPGLFDRHWLRLLLSTLEDDWIWHRSISLKSLSYSSKISSIAVCQKTTFIHEILRIVPPWLHLMKAILYGLGVW